jgi:hypothetical protein
MQRGLAVRWRCSSVGLRGVEASRSARVRRLEVRGDPGGPRPADPDVDGGFLIRVSDAGVNPLDSNLLERLTAASTYPFVMGIDFAGVIERGAAASDLRLASLSLAWPGHTAPTPSTRPLPPA